MDKKAQWAMVGAFWFLALGVVGIGWYTFVQRPSVDGSGRLPSSAVCPVTGKDLRVSPQTPSVRYQDKLYFFAAGEDAAGHSPRDLFLMDPSRYISSQEEP